MLSRLAAGVLVLTLVGPAQAGERTFTVRPDAATGGFRVEEHRPMADWRWSGTLPDGRRYRVLVEPHAGNRWATVEVGGGGPWVRVPAAWVCPDADLLMRLSAACR